VWKEARVMQFDASVEASTGLPDVGSSPAAAHPAAVASASASEES
jgi:hypothetical protein